jgi:large subunit ribosomal protein L4e
MARGHRVDEVPELPLVVDNSLQGVQKTREAYAIMQRLGAAADCDKAKDSKKIRAGKGKMRNRRYVLRRGPLVIYDTKEGVDKAFRNLPGVETTCVDRLNLLQLAPGGHMGRFCVWTQAAFEKLDTIYGTYTEKGLKSGYTLPRNQMTNADLARIINSDEVQSVLKPVNLEAQKRSFPRKRNPLKNIDALERIAPYAAHARREATKAQEDRKGKRDALLKEKRERVKADKADRKERKKAGREFYASANQEGSVKF